MSTRVCSSHRSLLFVLGPPNALDDPSILPPEQQDYAGFSADSCVFEAHDVVAWGRWMMRHQEQTQVGYDELPDGTRVSTKFLGLALIPFGDPMRTFETCVFGGGFPEVIERYSSWRDAELGHAACVAELRKRSP